MNSLGGVISKRNTVVPRVWPNNKTEVAWGPALNEVIVFQAKANDQLRVGLFLTAV
jgi:hypothetical protein